VAAGAGASGSAAAAAGPGIEPKEYRREELPEKSIRSFADVKGCDESKAELQVGGRKHYERVTTAAGFAAGRL